MSGYPGGKSGAGIAQRFLNLIPPHETYAAPFAGFDTLARIKLPAERTVVCDLHRPAIVRLALELTRLELPNVEALHGDGIAWLRTECGLDRVRRRPRAKAPDAEFDDCQRPELFCFIDPPYPLETRTGGKIYAHELDTAGQVRLLKTLVALP